ncbi:MAG TPA: MMPL family transporter [Solirubrobacterales bacterium]|nr:MMPL family transporter [Solirubrobacterales bacterium]
MSALTRFVLAHRRLVVAFWVVLTIVGIATVGKANESFSEEFSVPGREGFETNEAIAAKFGNGGNVAPLLAVVKLPAGVGVGAPGVSRELAAVEREIEEAVPDTRTASFASTGSRAFVSADGHTTFVVAYPPKAKGGGFGGDSKTAEALAAALRRETVAGAPVRLTGLNALSAETGGGGGMGLLAEALVGGLGALVVLAFVFASLMAFVPLLVALVSIMISFLAAWGLTAITPISPIATFLIALVGLGVAIDYTLLIVVRWREERAHGHRGEEAIVRTMERAGRAVVFSGTTVGIGLLSLVVLPVPFLASVGYAGMLIPLVSVAVAITLVPIVLAAFGERLDWPHVRSDDRASRSWTAWAGLVVRHRALAAVSAVAVLGALLVAAASIHMGAADGNPNSISKGGRAEAGLRQLEAAGIGSGALSPVEVLADPGGAAALPASLERVEGVTGAVAPAGPAWERGGRRIVDAFPETDSEGTAHAVRDAAHAALPGSEVGGIVAENADFIDAVYGSFPLMVGVMALLTFLLLARAFRSVLLPAKAVLLNVASVAAAWGVLVLIWQEGHGSRLLWGIAGTESVPSWLPVIVFAFLFGLSMDYEVFILARMREARDRGASTDEAVVEGIGRTGRLVTSAALILFLGFVSMATAPEVQVKMIATGLGAGILIDATIIRSLLVPAAVALFGRWNWWLPAPMARLLRVRTAEG